MYSTCLFCNTRLGANDVLEQLPVGRRIAFDARAGRLALRITNRSFWGRGAVGSEPKTPLPRLPLVDRLALEMAANEDAERRAMQGELAALDAAWREAEEIAAIADGMFDDSPLARLAAGWRTPRASRPALRSPGVASPEC